MDVDCRGIRRPQSPYRQSKSKSAERPIIVVVIDSMLHPERRFLLGLEGSSLTRPSPDPYFCCSKKLITGMLCSWRTCRNWEAIFASRCDFFSRSCTMFRLTLNTVFSSLRMPEAVLATSEPRLGTPNNMQPFTGKLYRFVDAAGSWMLCTSASSARATMAYS